jgi:hypothetical protein
MFRFTIRDVLWLTVVVALVVGWWIERTGLRSERQTLHDEIQRLKEGPEWMAADRLMDSFALRWNVLQQRERELGMEESPSPLDADNQPGDAAPQVPAVIFPKTETP